MNDNLYKGRFEGLNIAFAYAVATETVNEIVIQHDCNPAAAHLLGRAITGGLLSAAIQPDNHRLNICWKYRGALRTIVVDAGQDGTVRGFIAPAQLTLADDDLDALYGDLGDLQVVTSREGTVINSGTAPISLHDVAKDLAYYHSISDQVETGLTALIGFNPDPENPVQLCKGWMIQALPDCDLERFDRIRRRMDDPAFRDLLACTNNPPVELIAQTLIAEEADFKGIHMDAGSVPHFACPCTREKMTTVVRTLPIPERMDLVKSKENVRIRCQFCNTLYDLTVEECIAAWNQKPGT